MSNNQIKIGIIGGSGVDSPDILENIKQVKKHTPYGRPSDLITTGTYKGVEVAIIARHGQGHRIFPTMVNYRANVWALKELGVTHIIASTACGSLREEVKPGDLVFIDQFIDRTTKRHQTFYEGQEVCHIPMADPFCDKLRGVFIEAADRLKISNHKKGTMVTIEGPRFSTKAESNLFRSWGADVINMTTVPEAVLAREAGICYASIAMATDYDCWHKSEEPVSVEMILKVMKDNADNVIKILLEVMPRIDWADCQCQVAIKGAIL